jgi:hypothetical protein
LPEAKPRPGSKNDPIMAAPPLTRSWRRVRKRFDLSGIRKSLAFFVITMNDPTDDFMRLVKQKYLSSQSIKLTDFLQF